MTFALNLVFTGIFYKITGSRTLSYEGLTCNIYILLVNNLMVTHGNLKAMSWQCCPVTNEGNVSMNNTFVFDSRDSWEFYFLTSTVNLAKSETSLLSVEKNGRLYYT